MRWIALIMFALVACSDHASIQATNPHTGATIKASEARTRAVSATTTVEARVVRVRLAKQDRYYVKTFVLRSDRNYPKISAAHSFGVVQPYTRDDRHRIGIWRAEAGHIPLSANRTAQLAVTGFQFQLSGPRGTYVFSLPSSMFAEVLAPP